MSYLADATKAHKVPQSQPLPGRKQVQNAAGGFVFEIDCFSRLHRFLILGSEGGTYYAGQRELTAQNVTCISECLESDGLRTVGIIVQISQEGRAPKNDPAILALAMAAAALDDTTRKAALEALPQVCRIGTHLFMFMGMVKQFRGLGRGLRNALGAWYLEQEADDLAYQLIKYRNREGWTHADVLRLAHPKADDVYINSLLNWAVGKGGNAFALPEKIRAFEKLQKEADVFKAADLIKENRLPRETVPTELMKNKTVLSALLDSMPIGAMVRNLASMTSNGLLTFDSKETRFVCECLRDGERITKARLHPIAVISALKTYQSGYSVRGSNTWTPVPAIVDALEDAFYLAFGNVEATGLSRCIALDVSGSMGGGEIAGVPGLTPRIASAVMAMVSMKTGDPYKVIGFTSGGGGGYTSSSRSRFSGYGNDGVTELTLSPRQRLDDVIRTVSGLPFGGTDCALPMLWARQEQLAFHVFEVYTDNDTWAGDIHASEALKEYRKASGLNSKLAVVGMTSTGYSIADPNDPGMLDVVGFDTATPNLISAFAGGGF